MLRCLCTESIIVHGGALQVVSREPNNFYGNESCAVGNSTLIYSNAYGWGDEQCGANRTSICETMRACLAAYGWGRTVWMLGWPFAMAKMLLATCCPLLLRSRP